MGSQNQKRFRRSWNMRPHLFLLPLASLVSPLLCQLKFSGGVSSSSSNSNSNSPNRNTNNRPTDVDEKFFLGGDTPSLTGNQALDGGIVGLGLGALGEPSTVASRARATPVEGERGKQTLEDRHQEEKEGRILTERRGFSFPQVKAAPAMEGEGGKLLARMSLAQDSLAASLVDNSHTVAAAATTLSPSTTTTTGSIATSRTRASATRTPGGASATTASRSATRTGTHTGRAREGTTRGGPGATPPVGTTTAATFRGPTGTKTTPGPTGRAAIKADQELCGAVVFKQ